MSIDPIIRQSLEDTLGEHIATTQLARKENGWIYKQQLMDTFSHIGEYWTREAATIPIYENGERIFRSIHELLVRNSILGVSREIIFTKDGHWPTTMLPGRWDIMDEDYVASSLSKRFPYEAVLSFEDFQRLSRFCASTIFRNMSVSSVARLDATHLGVKWQRLLGPEDHIVHSFTNHEQTNYVNDDVFLVPVDGSPSVLLTTLTHTWGSRYFAVILNSLHPVGQWVSDFIQWTQEHGISGPESPIITKLVENIAQSTHNEHRAENLIKYLHSLGEIPNLPKHLQLPAIHLSDFTFLENDEKG
jgi:hypothetical protein